MVMTPDAFRRDRFLRATGYNFFVWGTVNVLVTWPAWAALEGRAWHPGIALVFVLVVIAAGVFACVLNDNRVAKMWGPPEDVPVVDAGAFWGPLLLIGFLLTVLLSVSGPVAYIQPAWMLLVGAGYLTWGNFGVPEFRWFGRALIAVGMLAMLAVDPVTTRRDLASPAALLLWMSFMGVTWLPFGALVNRRYVHALREPPPGAQSP